MLVGSSDNSRWSGVGTASPGTSRPLDLGHARWMQLTYEPTGNCVHLFPVGLHPTTPVLVTMQFWDVKEGDLGPFRMAQVRLTCRAGIRIRALTTNAAVNNAEVATVLAEGWGYPENVADIDLSWRTDQVSASVEVDGKNVLSGKMEMPMPIGVDDLQHITSINPALVGNDLRMLQVEPQIANLGVQRAAPHLTNFDSDFWNLGDHAPTYPVIAACADIQLALAPVRFIQDPSLLAHKGTIVVEAA
jgi:hypothetical protein